MAERQAAIKDMSEARIVMWEALQFCQKEGKVKHIGVSNYNTNGNKLVFAKEKDIGNVTWNIMDIEFSNRNEYEVEQI